MAETYNKEFFEEQREQGLRSARVLAPLVVDLIRPRSIIDVGCGVGAWLTAFKECGVVDVFGVDGEWAAGFYGLNSSEFLPQDLSKPLRLGRHFDLVVCLEVAEHLPETCAQQFVKSLTELGDLVLFSAAIPYQGGTLHVNEQWPEYWALLFEKEGYSAIDAIRPLMWNNSQVDWWYAQNALIFANNSISTPWTSACAARILSSRDLSEFRIVHPRNYVEKATRVDFGLKEALRALPQLVKAAVARRIRRLLEFNPGPR